MPGIATNFQHVYGPIGNVLAVVSGHGPGLEIIKPVVGNRTTHGSVWLGNSVDGAKCGRRTKFFDLLADFSNKNSPKFKARKTKWMPGAHIPTDT